MFDETMLEWSKMMELSKEEEKLLKGDYGDAARRVMEVAVKVGEIKGAQRMIDIVSVHSGILMCYVEGLGSFGTVGIELLEELAAAGLKFKVPYSTDVLGMDLREWKNMGLPDEFAQTQMRSVTALNKLGAMPGFSCLPYLEGNLPKPGDHVAWVETVDMVMANSYIGARSNREVDLTALAAALCGRTPEYGYHLSENRYGDLLIKVAPDLDYADLGALGFYVGNYAGRVGAEVPVFDGLRQNLSLEEIRHLVEPVAVLGPIGLVHIVGVTPEARTLEEAFGGKKTREVLTVGKKELKEASEALNSAKGKKLDLIVIGCSFCTLGQIKKIAGLLEGRKVHKGVTLWVQTSETMRHLAERCGDAQTIEKAGGRLYCACTYMTSVKKYYGFKVVATDAPCLAYIGPSTPWLGFEGALYGSTEQCVEAALTGRW
jgi:predicted aconitase